MSTVTSQAPSITKSSAKPPESGTEPSEEWKAHLKAQIEDGLKSMVQDAKDRLDIELRRAPVGLEERERLTQEYSDAMANIRKLASETFQTEVERERQERRWATGEAMAPHWNEALKQEQQDIMDRIKVQKESSNQQAPESPVEAPPPAPAVTRAVPVTTQYSPPPLPAELQSREREIERDRQRERERDRDRDRPVQPSLPKPRRISDSYANRDEHSQTYRHATYDLIPERIPHVPELDDSDEFTDEPEELLRPPERLRGPIDRSLIHDRSADIPVSRSTERPRSLSERRTTHSPPAIPEIWKPSISPEEDAKMAKPYNLGRRGSTASIRSTASGGIRPSVVESIPERAGDMMEQQGRWERDRVHESDSWEPSRERERQGQVRNESRQSMGSEQRQRYDEPVYSRGPSLAANRPPDASMGHPAPTTRPIRHQASFPSEDYDGPYYPTPSSSHRLVSRSSFTSDDRGYGLYSAPSTRSPGHQPYFSPNEDRERHYDAPAPRPYPTPPVSVRNMTREYAPKAALYDVQYREAEVRSNTWKVAQQPESPRQHRRPSESRAGSLITPYEDYYPDQQDYPSSSSIPISKPKHSPITDDVGHSWKARSDMQSHRSRDPRYESDYPYSHHPPEVFALPYPTEPVSGRVPRSQPSSYQANHRDMGYHFGGREIQDPEDYYEPPEGDHRDLRRRHDRNYDHNYQIRDERIEKDVNDREEEVRRAPEKRRVDDQLLEVGGHRAFEDEIQADNIRKQKEDDIRRAEQEAKRVEDDVKKLAIEARMKEEAAERLEEEARKKEEEARRKEEEAKRKEEEAKRKDEEATKREEEARKKEEATKKKEAEIKRKEKEVKRKEEEARKKEEEARRMEEKVKQMEDDALKKQREAKRKEDDARKRDAEATLKAEAAHQKEQETKKMEEAIRVREEELKRREAALNQREEESSRKENERLKKEQEEADRREAERLQRQFAQEDQLRKENERKQVEDKRRAEEERLKTQQQEDFKKRQEDIHRRRTEERKRQDSVGAESTWGPPSHSPQPPSPHPRTGPQHNGSNSSPSTERGGSTPSGWTSSTGSPWASSTKASTASSPSPARPPSAPGPKQRAGSMGSPFPTNPSPHPPSMSQTEEEWQRRQNEQTARQQEEFRREQERYEAARQAKASGRILTKEEVLWVFEHHKQQWATLKTREIIRWQDLPWPMVKMPNTPDDITFAAVDAYINSPHFPEARPLKDRIKDHLKKWHPDRFETKVLQQVVEKDKEAVKEGAGSVVRYLNELLTRSNLPASMFL